MWNHLLRTFIGFALLFTGTAGAADLIEAPEGTSAPTAELIAMPEELAEMADWAISLFDQAGLDLPPLRFVHHNGDLDVCGGRPGLHRRVDGVNVIEICTNDASAATEVLMLHETAHAWADHALTAERRDEFQQLRGWEHWRNHGETAWHDNGTEQAAEIMVWGLIDRPIGMIRIHQASCADLDAGYRTLTGQAPLHGFTDYC